MRFVDADEVGKILRETKATSLQEIIREIDELPTIQVVGGRAEYDIHTRRLKFYEVIIEGASPNALDWLFN